MCLGIFLALREKRETTKVIKTTHGFIVDRTHNPSPGK